VFYDPLGRALPVFAIRRLKPSVDCSTQADFIIPNHELNQIFASCQVAAQLSNPYGVVNDIFRDRDRVYISRKIRSSWPEFWKHFQYYG
jgi:hypothetical protein